ncbi:ribonuclease HII [Listeria newyorkensis]|uniref:Ribonuclease HII n=1 Tax=Listeria newyorkensis TaxID=1497681 RepID=A0ABX4XP02_9LIST|nr:MULTISPECIES: ribonuclease HII [Listeria]KGL45102.1 ribonuclease HII [Listeriaceae bacterium FSL A5-0209]KGL39998.1 ribonuclease HII [Listeria newyorkensis]KMT63624.1 ribonuclease HII [Listeria newyorkensis]PNP93283.1 ribonuclease HII [Listeria newyorkensis]RQW68256.1 ribonuclease HII [Listeria sp. SHR_NRA_18]
MAEKLAIIKERLQSVTSEADPFFQECLLDERKGVAKLVATFRREQAKKEALLVQLEAMKYYENEARAKGFQVIAGIDEVGRGPLAGPVVAAAVVLPADFDVVGVNDSKQLNEAKRDQLYDTILEKALAVGIGVKSHEVIDDVNIYEATKLAMAEAVDSLSLKPDFCLIDAMPLKHCEHELSLIKGDSKSVSIAAASIVAKVTRDRMMASFDEEFPGYGFAKNMGYGTKAHLDGLEKQGVCPIHRLTFAPVKNIFLGTKS